MNNKKSIRDWNGPVKFDGHYSWQLDQTDSVEWVSPPVNEMLKTAVKLCLWQSFLQTQ